MSLNGIMSAGVTGLITAQTQIRVTSDNIANVNTPGYARKIAAQESIVANGVGQGVRVGAIYRAVDSYLQRAGLSASTQAAQAAVQANFLDQAQSLFGDPSGDASFFSRLDRVYAAFSAAADAPSQALSRNNALNAVGDFLSEAQRISHSLKALGDEADQRIVSKLGRANVILQQIAANNTDISRATVVGADATGSQDIQSKLLDELAGLMDIRIAYGPTGAVTVRSSDGVLLAGDQGAASLAYSKIDGSGVLTATPPHAASQAILAGGGEIEGLIRLGQTELPALSQQLGELVAKAVDELNRAHNASSAAPPPAALNGRDTGLDLPTALAGFTGRTSIAVTDAAGVVQRTVSIDFDAMTLSVDGGPGAAFTGASFLAGLNAALGAFGSAGFSNGVLSLSAASGGVAVVDDPAAPSAKAGKGFSHFFGLNDLVVSTGYPYDATGLRATDPHGFTPGDQITLQLADANGVKIRQVTVTVPAAGTVGDLVSAMNAGVAGYGSFNLDAQGRLAFAASPGINAAISWVSDDTERGAGGPSISQLFVLGGANRAARAEGFSLRSDILQDSRRLALARFDASAGVGAVGVLGGDGRGALLLSQAGSTAAGFSAAGGLGAMNVSVSSYASELAGDLAAKAAAAQTRKEAALAVAVEASARRSAVEGVNLDEELVNLTTYQQAYNASARLIQAAKDMYDVLVNMI